MRFPLKFVWCKFCEMREEHASVKVTRRRQYAMKLSKNRGKQVEQK